MADQPSSPTPPSKPAPQTESARSLVDLMAPDAHEKLVDIFGLDGLSDFAKKFVTDSSDRIEKLIAAESAGQDTEVREQAHSLKGAALALGFPDLVHWARQIEHGETHLDDRTVVETAQAFKNKLDELSAVLNT